jgi:hypothetical protein
MNIHSKDRSAAMPRHLSPSALGLAVTAVLSLLTITALAQDPTPMAPPVQTDAPQGDSAGADSVFHWQEVPQGQEVPLTHAAFDQGGYQLYDTQGETIIIPFNSLPGDRAQLVGVRRHGLVPGHVRLRRLLGPDVFPSGRRLRAVHRAVL